MTFPAYKEIEIPLLLYIFREGGAVSSSSVYVPLGKLFNLTNDEISKNLSDGTNRPKWNNMVQWAMRKLAKQKYPCNPLESERGIWKLTDQGFKKAKSVEFKN